MPAEPRGGELLHALGRVVGLTLAALGAAFVMTLLFAGHGPAEATSAVTGVEVTPAVPSADVAPAASGATSASEGDAADDPSRPPLWAHADALSAASARRAASESAPGAVWSSSSVPPFVERDRADVRPDAGAQALRVGATSSPIGTLGASGGAPDAGPSITQLAVLAAALLGVLWLSQRLLASGLSWRSAFITLSIERPG